MARLRSILLLMLLGLPLPTAAQTVSSRVKVVPVPDRASAFTRAALESLSLSDLRSLIAATSVDTVSARNALIDGILNTPTITPQAVTRIAHDPQWLGQAGLTVGGGADPTISLEVYRFWLGLGEDIELPFYILGSIPALSGVDRDNLLSSVLDEYGGALNVGVGTPEWRPAFGRFLKWPSQSPFGLRLAARAGLKLLDVNAADTTLAPEVAALALGTFSAKLMLPVWADGGSRDPNDRAGSLQGEVTATLQWTNSDKYRSLFGGEELLEESLFYLNANLSLIITDYLYASTSFTLHASEDRLTRKSSLTFRYLK